MSTGFERAAFFKGSLFSARIEECFKRIEAALQEIEEMARDDNCRLGELRFTVLRNTAEIRNTLR